MVPELSQMAEYIKAHGGKPVRMDPSGTTLLLPDGARIRTNGPMFVPVPASNHAVIKLRIRYCEIRLSQAIDHERTLWQSFAAGLPWIWPTADLGEPPPGLSTDPRGSAYYNSVNRLKERLKEIRECRQQRLAEVRSELTAVKAG
jgi:hypothetical protein